MARDEKTAAIFQAKGEHAALFAVAQHRLQILEKWFIPIFSAIIAAYQTGMGLYLLKASRKGPGRSEQPRCFAVFF